MSSKKKVPDIWKEEIEKGGYFLGHRVHHGAVGGGLFLFGLKIGSPYIVGFGLGLMLDDIGDIDKWLDFEKGGDSNSFFSFKK